MTSRNGWHTARWPPLAWLETVIKLLAIAIGVATGWRALATPAFAVPAGWQLAACAILLLLSLGLVAAIADRWTDREVIAMVFVVLNNLGHWGMLLSLASAHDPATNLLPFASLMLLGDVVKLVFIRVHRFTVRDYSPATLYGLTFAYVVGYAFLILTELLR